MPLNNEFAKNTVRKSKQVKRSLVKAWAVLELDCKGHGTS